MHETDKEPLQVHDGENPTLTASKAEFVNFLQ